MIYNEPREKIVADLRILPPIKSSISVKQRDELIAAVKEYGLAEFEAGKELGDYRGSLEPAVGEAAKKYSRVIDLIYLLTHTGGK